MLVVDDDQTVGEVVERYLRREGCDVLRAVDGTGALALAQGREPDLVVLDLMLPGVDGLEVCRRLRRTTDVPIIMLTARSEPVERITGLELGADDYLTKPFSPRELVARAAAVLHRARGGGAAEAVAEPLQVGAFRVDLRARRVRVHDQPTELTAREFDLLAHLVRHPGRVFTREELLRDVWGYDFGDTSTVTVHVRRLREKIEREPSAPQALQTVWGVGYRFEP